MEKNYHVIFKSILCLLTLVLAFSLVQADNAQDVALILKAAGQVRVKKTKPNQWQNGTRGLRLDSGDIIKTYNKSVASVMFTDDKSLLKVRDNSVLAIRGQREKKSITKRIFCTLGNFWVKVQKQNSQLSVETPAGVAAVKGTEFYGVVDSDGNLTIIAIEGIVELINKLGQIFVEAGETGKMSKDKEPIKYDTPPDEKQDWGEEENGENELKFEFQDNDGNKRELKIEYK